MDKHVEHEINQQEIEEILNKNIIKAEQVLQDRDKIDHLLDRIESKLKLVPKVGEQLSYIPVFVQLIKAYISKKYTEIPIGSILAIIAALIYFLNPLDLIPDIIPGVGYLDDAMMMSIALKMVFDDVNEFIIWRDSNKINV